MSGEASNPDLTQSAGRVLMGIIGALAGLALWGIFELADRPDLNPHVFVTLAALVAGFFGVLLVQVGPLPPQRAVAGALAVSGPAALLLGWGSLGYETLEAYLGTPYAFFAWLVILFVGTPFCTVSLRRPQGWRDYPALFNDAWNIVVRYAAAWLFVGALFVVLFLSDALLKLVGLTLIEDLFELEPVPHLLTGAALGVSLAIVFELRSYISPFLLLRLLRLLVPVMLAVVVVFVVTVLMRGPGAVFAGLSPTATLLAVAMGCIALVSIALDEDDEGAVQGGWMRNATRVLALVLPVLVALAVWALSLRVRHYGWTPDRLAAAVTAGVATVYALGYLGAVVMPNGWMARIRRVNRVIAMGLVGLAALWLSPVLNAERISANSQVARYLGDGLDADQLPVWEMQHEWGHAGRAGVAQLAALPEADHAALHQRIEAARSAASRYSFTRRTRDSDRGAEIERLRAMITVAPQSAALPAGALDGLPAFRRQDWLAACAVERAPGCVMVLGRFDTARREAHGVLFLPARHAGFDALSVRLARGTLLAGSLLTDAADGGPLRLSSETVRRVAQGDYRIAPSSRKSLWIGDTEIIP